MPKCRHIFRLPPNDRRVSALLSRAGYSRRAPQCPPDCDAVYELPDRAIGWRIGYLTISFVLRAAYSFRSLRYQRANRPGGFPIEESRNSPPRRQDSARFCRSNPRRGVSHRWAAPAQRSRFRGRSPSPELLKSPLRRGAKISLFNTPPNPIGRVGVWLI